MSVKWRPDLSNLYCKIKNVISAYKNDLSVDHYCHMKGAQVQNGFFFRKQENQFKTKTFLLKYYLKALTYKRDGAASYDSSSWLGFKFLGSFSVKWAINFTLYNKVNKK